MSDEKKQPSKDPKDLAEALKHSFRNPDKTNILYPGNIDMSQLPKPNAPIHLQFKQKQNEK